MRRAPARTRALRLLLATADLLFAVTLALAAAAWVASPLRLPLGGTVLTVPWHKGLAALPLLLLALRLAAARAAGPGRPRGPLDRPVLQNLCLAFGSLFLFLVAVEQGFELAGYTHDLPPLIVREGDAPTEAADERVFIPDPVLRWRFNPGVEWHGRRINRLGFSDREIDPAKAPGAVRVISFGDSCTAQGAFPYSRVLDGLLRDDPPGTGRWEAFNMGVHGYSVYQGLLLFRTRGAALAPDVVTIFFGWNDHWRSRGPPDTLLSAEGVAPLQVRLRTLLRKKRFGQFLLALAAGLPRPGSGVGAGTLRVPPEEYRRLLTAFVREARGAGAVPLLLTAPRAARLHRLLVHSGLATSVEEAAALHDRYVALTREVARDEKARLVDLEAAFGRDPALFSRDGIHFTVAGIRRAAEEIRRALDETVESDEWRHNRKE